MSNDFYVYLHLRASDGSPFYVGKGRGRRINSSANRNKYWHNTVAKHGISAVKIYDGLSEDEAYRIEMDTILSMRSRGESLCNMTEGGDGFTGGQHSEETRAKISARISGKGNGNHNSEIHTFIHDKGGLEFTGTQFDMWERFGHCRSGITMLVQGKVNSFKGWRLSTSDDLVDRRLGPDSHAFNGSAYTFRNRISGDEFTGTQQDFRAAHGVGHSEVSAICNGKRKSAKGWECLTTSAPPRMLDSATKAKISKAMSGANNFNYDPTIRIFQHKDGRLEHRTMFEMKKLHGMSCHVSSLVSGKIAHHKGWAYLGVFVA